MLGLMNGIKEVKLDLLQWLKSEEEFVEYILEPIIELQK